MKVQIEDIENSSDKKLQLSFEDFIEGIKSKQPIKAELIANSMGDFIEITGNIKGCVTLECDLCLNEFEHELDCEINEIFAKNTLYEEYKEEIEIKEDQFVTDLQGKDFIDIKDFLYQSVILDFPNKKVCGIKCKGGDIFIRDENPQQEPDERMAIFKKIKIEHKQKK